MNETRRTKSFNGVSQAPCKANWRHEPSEENININQCPLSAISASGMDGSSHLDDVNCDDLFQDETRLVFKVSMHGVAW